MIQQLKILHTIITDFDNSPNNGMDFYTGTCQNSTIITKPPSNIRWQLVKDALHNAEHIVQNSKDCMSVDQNLPKILEQFNTRYQDHQNLCWKSHETHFHKTVEEYINCPMTCLFEISEFLDKLLKEIYHQ